MNQESPEHIKTSERTFEKEDPNGDHVKEAREYFADASWVARGEVTDGPNAGKSWVKGHGGNIEGTIELNGLGIAAPATETSTNDWGYMTSGGKEAGQPKTGDNWFKPVLHHEQEIPVGHAAEELVVKDGVEQETDDQGRITYEQKHFGEKHIVYRRTYHDEAGYMVETGKHVAGPEQGRVWETRRPIAGTIASSAELQTSAGSLRDLSIRSLTIDRELSDAEKSLMTQEQQEQSRDRMRKTATLDIGGKTWETAE